MKVRVNNRDGYSEARIEPLEGVYVGAVGVDGPAALHQASRLLSFALARPEVQQILPPGTVAAVKLIRGATAALRKGKIGPFLDAVTPTQAKFVAKALRRVLPWRR